MPEWRLPFPSDELEVRAMCSDPTALIYVEIADWIRQKQGRDPKIRLTPEEVLDCMWYQVHGDSMTRYSICRSELTVPDDFSKEMFERISAALKEFTSG